MSSEKLIAIYAVSGGGYDEELVAVADSKEDAEEWADEQNNPHVEDYLIGAVRYISTDTSESVGKEGENVE